MSNSGEIVELLLKAIGGLALLYGGVFFVVVGFRIKNNLTNPSHSSRINDDPLQINDDRATEEERIGGIAK